MTRHAHSFRVREAERTALLIVRVRLRSEGNPPFFARLTEVRDVSQGEQHVTRAASPEAVQAAVIDWLDRVVRQS